MGCQRSRSNDAGQRRSSPRQRWPGAVMLTVIGIGLGSYFIVVGRNGLSIAAAVLIVAFAAYLGSNHLRHG